MVDGRTQLSNELGVARICVLYNGSAATCIQVTTGAFIRMAAAATASMVQLHNLKLCARMQPRIQTQRSIINEMMLGCVLATTAPAATAATWPLFVSTGPIALSEVMLEQNC